MGDNIKIKKRSTKIGATFGVVLVCFAFLAGVFSLSQPQVCLATDLQLEQTYPKIPTPGGDKALEDIINQPGEEKGFGELVMYLTRLVFYLVLGACLVVLIIAGFLRMASAGNVSLAIKAQEMAKNGFLGLAILAFAFLILLVINPQLVLFNWNLPKTVPTPANLANADEDANKVVLYRLNPLLEAQVAVESVGVKISKGVDYDKDYRELDQANQAVAENRPYLLFKEKLKNNKLLGFLFQPVSLAMADDLEEAVSEIFKSELYLRQAELALGKVIKVIEGDYAGIPEGGVEDFGLLDIMEGCKCGDGKYHDEWKWETKETEKDDGTTESITGYYGDCIGGLDATDANAYWNSTSIQRSKENSQDVCGLQCQDCGESRLPNGAPSCDLREVRVRVLSIIDPTTREVKNVRVWEAVPYKPTLPSQCQEGTEIWGYYKIEPLAGDSTMFNPGIAYEIKDGGNTVPLSSCDYLGNKVEPRRFIKAKRLELQTALADLEGLKSKFVIEQVEPLGKVLVNNSMAFLLRNAHPQGRMLENDFEAFSQNLPSEYSLAVETPEKFSDVAYSTIPLSASSNKSFWEGLFDLFVKPATAFSFTPLDAGNFFIAIKDDSGVAFSGAVIDHNNFVYRESSRASLFSVLTDLSLERIEGFFQQCLTSAFGEAKYQVSREQIDSILQEAISNGSADRLIAALVNNIPALADLAAQNVAEGYKMELQTRLEGECAQSQECAPLPLASEEKNSCIQKCVKNNLSPDYISKTLLKTINKPVVDLLSNSGEFKDFLTKGLKTMLDEEFAQHIDTETVKYYDAILNGALTTSLGKMTRLDKVMETKLTDTPLLGTVLSFVSSIDKGIACRINGCCRATNDYGSPIRNQADCKTTFEKQTTPCEKDGIAGGCNGYGTCAISGGPVSGLDKGCYKGEVFRSTGGKGQCCEDGLRQSIAGYTKKYVSDLVTKYTSGKVSEKIQDFREGHPSLFPQYSSIPECYQQRLEGRVFKFEGENIMGVQFAKGSCDKIESFKGECIQLTSEQINQISSFYYRVNLLECDDNGTRYKIDDDLVVFGDQWKKDVCEGAGYCWSKDWQMGNVWDGRDAGSEKCGECQWLGQDVDTSGGAGGTLGRLKNKALAGLINFGEQFISALVQVTLETAFEYADVFIQDEIVYPLSEYFEPAGQLYSKLQKVLNADIGDVLPAEVSKTLEMSIEQMTKAFCQEYEAQDKLPINQGKADSEKTFDFSKKVKMDISWLQVKKADNTYQTLEITPGPDGEFTSAGFVKFANDTCRLNKHLHTTLLEEFAASGEMQRKIAEALNGNLVNLLQKVCWGEEPNQHCLGNYLAMTPAEILFEATGLMNINDLIKATPKSMICGQTKVQWQDKSDGQTKTIQSPKSKCAFESRPITEILDVTAFDSLIKTLPLPKVDKTKLPQDNLDFYRGYCYVTKALCDPLGTIFQSPPLTTGNALKLLVEASCQYTESKAGKEPNDINCSGKCLTGSEDTNLIKDAGGGCSIALKGVCKGCCIATKDSIALSLFRVMFRAKYGPESQNNTSADFDAEIETYKKLYPALGALLQTELKKTATLRGVSAQKWQEIVTNPNNTAVILKDIFDYVGNKTLKDVLIDIPFGVVKPMEPNGPTITGKNLPTNFLSRTPSQLLFDDVCYMIVQDFENDPATKKWAMSTVYQNERAGIGSSLPYSMESLRTVNLAKVIDKILEESNLPEAATAPYIFCKVQNNTPAEILGLDEPLMSFIRPKELQIMFQLIEDYLNEPGDKPDWLTEMIDVLNSQTAVSLLASMASQPGAPNELGQLVGFLNTSLRKQVESQLPTDPIIVLICQDESLKMPSGEGSQCDLGLDLSGLNLLANLLTKKPVDLLPMIKTPVIPALNLTLGASLIDLLAGKYEWIGKPLIDTLGPKVGLDKALYSLGEAGSAITSALDKTASKTEEFVKKTSGVADTALIEAPVGALSGMVDWVTAKIANLFGNSLAIEATDQMMGSCAEKPAGTTSCGANEVLKEIIDEATGVKTINCCTVGQPAVCEAKCRTIPTEGCKINEGEVEDNGKCCYNLGDDGCAVCRLKRADAGGKCNANEFETKAGKDNVLVCCQERSSVVKKDANDKDITECCSTVLECVNRNFSHSLDGLADSFARGSLPLSSLLK